MGAWGYMIRESDDGLDTMSELKVDANGVLDVDKNGINNIIENLTDNMYSWICIENEHKTFMHVVSEIVYELSMNNIDDLCKYSELRKQIRKIKKIEISYFAFKDLINEMTAYLEFNKSDEGKEYWTTEDTRQDCIKYIEKQLEVLQKVETPRYLDDIDDLAKKIILFIKE